GRPPRSTGSGTSGHLPRLALVEVLDAAAAKPWVLGMGADILTPVPAPRALFVLRGHDLDEQIRRVGRGGVRRALCQRMQPRVRGDEDESQFIAEQRELAPQFVAAVKIDLGV